MSTRRDSSYVASTLVDLFLCAALCLVDSVVEIKTRYSPQSHRDTEEAQRKADVVVFRSLVWRVWFLV
jgi:hypothetical protein